MHCISVEDTGRMLLCVCLCTYVYAHIRIHIYAHICGQKGWYWKEVHSKVMGDEDREVAQQFRVLVAFAEEQHVCVCMHVFEYSSICMCVYACI